MRKKTYILGAGFSANAGVHIQNDFLTLITRPSNNFRNEYEKHLDDRITLHITRFMRDVFDWYPGCSADEIPSLEDIFTCIDLSARDGHNLGKDYTPAKLRAIRRFLIFKIFEILNVKFEYSVEIQKFIEGALIGENNNFISLNWDIVLENHINSSWIDGYSLNYGIKCEPLIKSHLDNNDNGKQINLAKIHGSSNWVYCDNCRKVFYNIHSKLAKDLYAGIFVSDIKLMDGKGHTPDSFKKMIREHFPTKMCPNCRCALGTHIATFSFIKSFRTKAFVSSWEFAEDLLDEADEWVFIGYSLPDADYEFKHLLKRCQLKKNPKFITAVFLNDKNAEKRFKKFFGQEYTLCIQGGVTEYNTKKL